LRRGILVKVFLQLFVALVFRQVLQGLEKRAIRVGSIFNGLSLLVSHSLQSAFDALTHSGIGVRR
jgi:hypothetical protein